MGTTYAIRSRADGFVVEATYSDGYVYRFSSVDDSAQAAAARAKFLAGEHEIVSDPEGLLPQQ